MQPERAREVRAWLKRAEDDLRAAKIDIEATPPLIEDALFHCQQAAEKSMKGFLAAHEKVFRRTHDLDELALACEAIDASLRAALDPARDLTVFAWAFRYPGETEEPSLDETKNWIEVASRVYEENVKRVPPDT